MAGVERGAERTPGADGTLREQAMPATALTLAAPLEDSPGGVLRHSDRVTTTAGEAAMAQELAQSAMLKSRRSCKSA